MLESEMSKNKLLVIANLGGNSELVCLVWKWLMDSVEYFSTMPDIPSCHIMKNPKIVRAIYLLYNFLYIPVWGALYNSRSTALVAYIKL